jgi:hypothetical protein
LDAQGFVRNKILFVAKRLRRIYGQRVANEKVRQYIINQEEHHAKISFKEEFIKLLRANDIEI